MIDLSLWYMENDREIHTISSYLSFGYFSLQEFRQELKTELKQRVNDLRLSQNIPNEIADEEILSQIYTTDFEWENVNNEWLRISGVIRETESSFEYDEMFFFSFVIMWYSLVERRLIDLCEQLNIENQSNINNRQGVIYRVYDSLDKGVSYKIDGAYWEELKLISRLRNTIIHSGLILPVDESSEEEILYSNYDAFVKVNPQLLEYLKSKHLYVVEGRAAISLNLEYCEYLVEFSSNMLLKIYRDIRNMQK